LASDMAAPFSGYPVAMIMGEEGFRLQVSGRGLVYAASPRGAPLFVRAERRIVGGRVREAVRRDSPDA
jgi:hypothetical protein